MTETSPLATVSFERSELKGAPPEERYRRAAMQGNIAPLVEMRLVTDDGTLAPWDGKTMGELQVRGPFITGGYHEVPTTEDKFATDAQGRQWLRTGDVAILDDLGCMRLTDRTKDLINLAARSKRARVFERLRRQRDRETVHHQPRGKQPHLLVHRAAQLERLLEHETLWERDDHDRRSGGR